MGLSEADTRAKLIGPAIHARGWTEDLIRREETAGAIEIIDGRPFKQTEGRIDYTLRIKATAEAQPVAVALVAVKPEDKPPGHGLEQAKLYAASKRLNTQFVFASNGHQFVADRIVKDGLRQNLGATRAATVIATLATSIKHKGKKSPFVRVSEGTYDLAKRSVPAPSAITVEGSGIVGADAEEQYAIVAAFGMFWRREAVDWVRAPKLLGMQQIGATPVDFTGQRGVYLLYDGREVIYVGRTTDRALGTRLYEHTIDRLSTRWDRFSWFGLLPVSNTSSLGKMPATFDATKLAPALEAILVEALEPRQNRKRGDDLAAVEYVQMEDPEIQKRRVKAAIDEALNKA